MDQELKSYKLASASARRKKFQDRQAQQSLEIERRLAHKKRLTMYDHLASGSDAEEEEGRYERDSSVDTISDRSVLTPDDSHSGRSRFDSQSHVERTPPLKILVPEQEMEQDMVEAALNEDCIMVPPSPSPILQASLATLSDFRYDRYSVMFDSPSSETLTPELDFDESLSPIETATHVAYQLPKSRPSLISITTSVSSRSKRRTLSIHSPLSRNVSLSLERPSKRMSTSSAQSAYPAAEATLFEVPDLPFNAFEIIANASQESLPMTMNINKVRTERKSSVPRLSTTLSHTRMSSIKSLIKTPTSATHSRTFSGWSSSHTSRPSTSSVSGVEVSNLMKHAGYNGSTTTLDQSHRPPTSMSMRSMSSHHGHMTALPSLPAPITENNDDPLANKPSMGRKKSFSALRRRSESLGQAIKGLSKINTKHDVPLPSPPVLTPRFVKHNGLGLSASPTPPLPSPYTGKSNVGSYTASTPRSSHGVIGLGLKSVEGLWQR